MSRRRPYRGALLGLGDIARYGHLPAFLEDPLLRRRVRIVAGVDKTPKGAEEDDPLRHAGIPRLTSREELVTLGELDFVDICTPTSAHLELALWALGRGYHVLCEKPVALDAAEARLLADASRRAGRLLVPCHQYRFNPVWQQITAWLQDDVIGRWHLAELAVYRPRADPGIQRGGLPWRGRRTESRGGVLVDHGTHWLYLLLELAGPPAAVQAWSGRLAHPAYDVEDTVQLSLEYHGRLVTLFLTWAGGSRESRVRFIGERGTIEWVGGELRLETRALSQRLDLSTQLAKSAYPGWFAQLFQSFVAALDAGGPAPFEGEVARVAELIETIYAACESGRKLTLPASA
jgi:predicted dehydrogenase